MKVLKNFYTEIEASFALLLKKRKEEALVESYHVEMSRKDSRNSSSKIIEKLRKGQAKELTSKEVAVLKKELLNQEE